ncbi:hypothetical protein PRK78_001504 [Emydomyces testavorans]|uniref:Cupin type-2 domain-containing protein n=1 Tax=Emydomyces testavorans TaxID=2070801 RepID=A0AAF0IIR0_9EURO|nr:hypothetical protein PRK78_001504 [Emydomyces testavorans]
MSQEEPKPTPCPPFRRIVTGHSPTGEAIIESDQQLTPYDPLSENFPPATTESPIGFTTLWQMNLSSFPINADEPCPDFNNKPVPLANPDGLTARIVNFPPGPGMMHRTLTVDFGIVLNGEMELELDNGVKTLVRQHDLVVQRGTIHAWNNPGPEPARMMFVLVASKPLKFGDKVLEPSPLPPGLDGSALGK